MSDQIPLNALRVFEAVARSGSFTRAATELFITQSAVSHQVKALEQWLGQPLFERNHRVPRLLPAGAALLPVLTGALSDIQNACRRLREQRGGQLLVIAVIPSIATCWLIPRLSEFRNLHPNIGIRIVYAIHGSQADFQDVDLAITYATQRSIGDGMTPLMAGIAAPVCSASFARTHGAFKNIAVIGRAQLLHDTDFSGWKKWFRRARLKPPQLEHSLIFEDFNLLRAATLAGQGVSLCPLQLVEDDLASGRLVQISTTTVSENSGYYIRQAAAAPSPQSTQFRNWLLAAAQSGQKFS